MINERIRQVRKSQNLTLEKFGEKLGVKRNTVSQWENGVNNITDSTIMLICKEFNVNEDWLRNGQGPKLNDVNSKLDDLFSELSITDQRLKDIIINYMNFPDDKKEMFMKFAEFLNQDEATKTNEETDSKMKI
jgi:transcriptional regulator with XRE-family HTH domain